MQISTKSSSTVKAPIEFVYEHFYSNKIQSNGSTFVYLKKMVYMLEVHGF